MLEDMCKTGSQRQRQRRAPFPADKAGLHCGTKLMPGMYYWVIHSQPIRLGSIAAIHAIGEQHILSTHSQPIRLGSIAAEGQCDILQRLRRHSQPIRLGSIAARSPSGVGLALDLPFPADKAGLHCGVQVLSVSRRRGGSIPSR